jgi:formiminoglutamase
MLPILLSIPHGGTRQPAELAGRVCLTPKEQFDDSDPFTLEIYDLDGEVSEVVTTDIARAYVDLNRSPDERPPDHPDGVVKSATCHERPIYNRGSEPDDPLIEELLGRYYHPYHDGLVRAGAGPAVKLALDCHSMLAESPAIDRTPGRQRPLFCLGNVDGLTCPAPLLGQLQRAIASAFDCSLTQVRLNDPFKGGHITRTHGRGGVPWVQVEMNRSLYLDPEWFRPETLEVDPGRLQHLRSAFRAALHALEL